MRVDNAFRAILAEKTRSGFHDAALAEICIQVEDGVLAVRLQHYRDKSDGSEVFVESRLVFSGVSSLAIQGIGEAWGGDLRQRAVGSGVYDFDVTSAPTGALFRIVGTSAWTIQFHAQDFDYEERLLPE